MSNYRPELTEQQRRAVDDYLSISTKEAEMAKRKPDEDEEKNNLELQEELQDNQRVRLPLMLKDSGEPPTWMSDADNYFEKRAAVNRITAGDGLPTGLHKPGYRMFSDARRANLADRRKEAAYVAYDRQLQDAYKSPQRDVEGYAATDVGGRCMISNNKYFPAADQGDPGTIQYVENVGYICVPDKKSPVTSDALTESDRAYQIYDEELRTAYLRSR